MLLNEISESLLKSLATPTSFARGVSLFENFAIFDTFREGDTLVGKCAGSSAPYYDLNVTLEGEGIQDAYCDCPYDWGGYCKHLIAFLLTYIHSPEMFAARESVENLIEDLDKDALVQLVGDLVEQFPNAYDWLRGVLSDRGDDPHPDQSSPEPPRLSEKVYERKIDAILDSVGGYRLSEAYWKMGEMVSRLDDVLITAEGCLRKNDAQGALIILTALFVAVGERYADFDDSDGALASLIDALVPRLVEAILSADLSESAREARIETLSPVIETLNDYGFDGLDVLLVALRRGWTDEKVDYLTVSHETTINNAKLNILERQDRIEDFLTLCLKSGQYYRYCQKQIAEGALDAALQIASERIIHPYELLNIARALADADRLTDALRLGKKGLSMEGVGLYELGIWVGSLEEKAGHREGAMEAYQAAFISRPTFDLYLKLRQLSSHHWDQTQPVLLAAAKECFSGDVLVDILLYEGEWDQTIELVDQAEHTNYSLIEKVADGVLDHRPDWVIKAAQAQAEGLIARTGRKYYVIATRWLLKVREAYRAVGREADWVTYFEDLKQQYARRPALLEELQRLAR